MKEDKDPWAYKYDAKKGQMDVKRAWISKKVFEVVRPKEDSCSDCSFRRYDKLSGYLGCSGGEDTGWRCIYESERWKEGRGIPEWCPYSFYEFVEGE